MRRKLFFRSVEEEESCHSSPLGSFFGLCGFALLSFVLLSFDPSCPPPSASPADECQRSEMMGVQDLPLGLGGSRLGSFCWISLFLPSFASWLQLSAVNLSSLLSSSSFLFVCCHLSILLFFFPLRMKNFAPICGGHICIRIAGAELMASWLQSSASRYRR